MRLKPPGGVQWQFVVLQLGGKAVGGLGVCTVLWVVGAESDQGLMAHSPAQLSPAW